MQRIYFEAPKVMIPSLPVLIKICKNLLENAFGDGLKIMNKR